MAQLIKQWELYLVSFLADAVRFVPTYFSGMNCPVDETDTRESFQFSPVPFPVSFLQPKQLPNSSPYSDRLDVCDASDKLKIHQRLRPDVAPDDQARTGTPGRDPEFCDDGKGAPRSLTNG
jgi:hypothetical protein